MPSAAASSLRKGARPVPFPSVGARLRTVVVEDHRQPTRPCRIGFPHRPRDDPVTCTSDPISNQLLAALPGEVLTRWRHQLERVELPLGVALHEAGCPPSHVYFPTTAIVSLLYATESGKVSEIAMVGNEGVVGIALFMGGETTPNQAVDQSAGVGYRLKAEPLKAEFGLSAPVMHLLLRYTQALITQMAQTAACNRHHSVDQQLCRWLLMSLDRLRSHEMNVTQELIANMLGIRREGVP